MKNIQQDRQIRIQPGKQSNTVFQDLIWEIRTVLEILKDKHDNKATPGFAIVYWAGE